MATTDQQSNAMASLASAADEQNERDGNLGHNESSTKVLSSASCSCRVGALFQNVLQIQPRILDRGCEAEQQRGEDGNAHCKQQYTGIEVDLFQARQAVGAERDDHLDEPAREQHPTNAAETRQYQAFGHQLT